MTKFGSIGAAVIGTGFIGHVHVQMLRRLGVRVVGVLGSSPDRGRERASEIGVSKAFETLEELLADKSVDVVHVASPNDLHFDQTMAALKAGKHVICEKPLAMTAEQSSRMVEEARNSGKIAAVCYNIRFYPLNQHAHGMMLSGDLGDIRLISGHYHQDWLAKNTDWNWRLEKNKGGPLRSVGDIGTHWVDLTKFITGLKAEAVMAELATFIPKREKPSGPLETFSAVQGETVTEHIHTDDAAMILIRYSSGARGVMSTSQISFGRKNSLRWDISGSRSSAAWDSETPDHLFIGHRDKANETLMRDFTLMNAKGSRSAAFPPGHVEGFGDSFNALFGAVYSDIFAGSRQDGSTWATFEDGHYEMLFCDAVLRSAKQGCWVELESQMKEEL